MHELKNIDTILFDLDGTLTDSGEGIINAVKYALKLKDMQPLPDNELKQFVGPPLIEAFIDKFKMTRSQAEELVGLFRVYYNEKGVYENKLYPGIVNMLCDLTRMDKRLMICSSKPQHLADLVTQRFDIAKYFYAIAGADLKGLYTEKNSIIDRMVLKYSLDKNTVLVGDRCFDIAAARHTQINSVAVTWGYGSIDELKLYEPDYIVDNTGELTDLFK